MKIPGQFFVKIYSHEISWPRTCVFVGTTNRSDYLQDETGNRRFLPLRLTKEIPQGTAAGVRDQFWAEAVAAYKAGEAWWFKGEILEVAQAEQAARLAGDPWDHELPGVLAALLEAHTIPTSSNILRGLFISSKDQDKRLQGRVGGILTRLGFENKRRRIAGTPTRYWWHPDHGVEPVAEWEAKMQAEAAEASATKVDWDA